MRVHVSSKAEFVYKGYMCIKMWATLTTVNACLLHPDPYLTLTLTVTVTPALSPDLKVKLS